MKKLWRFVSICIPLGFLTGCGTTYWSHPNFSMYEAQRDHAMCEYEAKSATALPAQQFNPYLNSAQQSQQAFANAGASFAQAYALQDYHANCMLRKGYFKVAQ